jgi:hypothetical protein
MTLFVSRWLFVAVMLALASPAVAAPPTGVFEMSWAQLKGKGERVNIPETMLKQFSRQKIKGYTAIWVRFIWVIENESLTIYTQVLQAPEPGSQKQAIGCEARVTTSIRWAKNDLIIPASVSGEAEVMRISSTVTKEEGLTEAKSQQDSDSCSASIDQARLRMKLRADGVLVAQNLKTRDIIELVPTEKDPDFMGRYAKSLEE